MCVHVFRVCFLYCYLLAAISNKLQCVLRLPLSPLPPRGRVGVSEKNRLHNTPQTSLNPFSAICHLINLV